jgi:hypothetical protein
MLVKFGEETYVSASIVVLSVKIPNIMNSLSKSVVTFLFPILIAPVVLAGATVVYENPDGATLNRDGGVNVSIGMELMQGDVLDSGDATVILSLCEGSLVTVYPNSVVAISSMSDGSVALSLTKGEILGDASVDCQISVATAVGTASVTDGVFGVLMNSMANGAWTLQVRNLDGSVKFVGDPNLDTSNTTVSLIEPNKQIEIPSGEEVIVRGLYNESAEAFVLAEEGAAIALLGDEVSGEMRTAAQQMAAAAGQGGAPEADAGETAPVIIEIPLEDVETASDKG